MSGEITMNEPGPKLKSSPIVEAVLDIDCDLPPGLDFTSLERPAGTFFLSDYPTIKTVFVQEHEINAMPDSEPTMSIRRGIQAVQFLKEDQKQLVQIRPQGFSFNRLAPYSTLDDYLPEIERCWKLFIALTSPVQVRAVRLRYLNRILLPLGKRGVVLEDYLKFAPKFPNETLTVAGFLSQIAGIDEETGNHVNVVLTGQTSENETAPVIFDITAAAVKSTGVENWNVILATIGSLRSLKNRVFRDNLTDRCLNLYQ
jgi:uncharacterized protein (TIGR04255 family)